MNQTPTDKPRIFTLSAVICNYNHAEFIGRAIQAMLDQSHRPDEVIVVDDASTDNSAEVITEIAARDPIVRMVRNEVNCGVVFSYSRAIALASSDWVYAGAADDYVLPGFFERSMTMIETYPHAALCCSDVMTMYVDSGVEIESYAGRRISEGYYSPEDLVTYLKRIPVDGHTAVFNKSAFESSGGHHPETKWFSDWFTFQAMALRGGACYVQGPLVYKTDLSTSYSAGGRRDSVALSRAIRFMMDLIDSAPYADVRDKWIKSRVFAGLGMPTQMTVAVFSYPPRLTGWRFHYLLIGRMDQVKRYFYPRLRSLAPRWLKRLYRRLRPVSP